MEYPRCIQTASEAVELEKAGRVNESYRTQRSNLTRLAAGIMLAPVAIGTTVVVYENKEFIEAGVAYWRSDKNPEEGDIYLQYNDCAGTPPPLVSGGPEGARIESGFYEDYDERSDKIFQDVRDNSSAATRRPSLRPSGYLHSETMFTPFGGGYFDVENGVLDLSFGAELTVYGSSKDQPFQIHSDAIERMIEDMFTLTDIYHHPYLRDFVACRRTKLFEEGEYEGTQNGLYIIAHRYKGLEGNNVVTFAEGERSHSFGLGMADMGISIFGNQIMPDGWIIVPGSARPGHEEPTLERQLNKRLIEELAQWLLSGGDKVKIANEFVKLERNVDYIIDALWAYYEETGTMPLMITLDEKV